MNTKKLKKNATLRTTLKNLPEVLNLSPNNLSTGRPTKGMFYLHGRDKRWVWALVTASLKTAEILTSYASVNGLAETKFSATLIENYLTKSVPERELNACKVTARGTSFAGKNRPGSNVWIEIGMSPTLARTARDLKLQDPTLRELTDYQLISEILKLSLCDFLVADAKLSPFLQAPTEPTRTRVPTHPETDSTTVPVCSRPALEAVECPVSQSSHQLPDRPDPADDEISITPEQASEPPQADSVEDDFDSKTSQEPVQSIPKKSSTKVPSFVRKAMEAQRNKKLEL